MLLVCTTPVCVTRRHQPRMQGLVVAFPVETERSSISLASISFPHRCVSRSRGDLSPEITLCITRGGYVGTPPACSPSPPSDSPNLCTKSPGVRRRTERSIVRDEREDRYKRGSRGIGSHAGGAAPQRVCTAGRSGWIGTRRPYQVWRTPPYMPEDDFWCRGYFVIFPSRRGV